MSGQSESGAFRIRETLHTVDSALVSPRDRKVYNIEE